jgi:hypothetical protein
MARLRRRLWVRIAGHVAYNLAILVAVDFAFFSAYVHRMRGRQEPPVLAETARKAGIPLAALHSIGSYGKRRHEHGALVGEHPGVVRIAVLGDSFAWGEEVDDGLEYPAHLRRRLSAAGFDNVEVVNFGASGHGLGQNVRLWEAFGRGLAPDFVLVGPQGLFAGRDQTFNHTLGFQDRPYALHGRYVLDAEGLRWLDVLGATGDSEDRFRSYYAFVPAWRYLRYDRNAPAFLTALTFGRRLPNPFYYSRSSMQEEADALWPALLGKVAESGEQLLFVQGRAHNAAVAERVRGPLEWAHLPDAELPGFPYERVGGHLSASGNALVAEAFFAMLTNRPAIEYERVRLTDPAPVAEARGALEGYGGAEVRIGGRRAGTLEILPADVLVDRDEPVDFARGGVRGLLAIAGPEEPLLDAHWLALEEPVRTGQVVEIIADSASWRGTVALVSGEVPIGVVRIAGVRSERRSVVWRGPGPLGGARRGTLTLAGRPLADLVPQGDGGLEVRSRGARWVQAFPLPGDVLDLGGLAPSGPVELALGGAEGRTLPFGWYAKRAVRVAWQRHGAHRYLAPTPGGRGAVVAVE